MLNINNLFPNINNTGVLPRVENPRSVTAGPANLSVKESPQLSPLAQIVYSNQLTDLNFSSSSTSYAYSADDNSLAMHASSEFDAHLQQQTISLGLTFSAELLGLEAKDFAETGGKPITTQFFMRQTITTMQHSSTTQIVQPTRSALDVLKDMAKGLTHALRSRGNKSVRYVLDAEAMKAILSDGEMTKMMAALVMLMATINLSKEPGPSKDYVIYVSGKEKPYIDHREKTSVESREVNVNISITINPPASMAAPAAAVSAPAVQPAGV
jgi:hypothetical protein